MERIADFAARVNDHAENIGARRLHTVMERLLDELSFEAPELREKTVIIDEAYVDRMLAGHRRRTRICRDTSCRISGSGHRSQEPLALAPTGPGARSL